MSETDDSVIKDGEYHPAADAAMAWYKLWKLTTPMVDYMIIRESIASTALSGNRLAQITNGTLNRLDKGEPVSDRYLLGLCWFLRHQLESKAAEPKTPRIPKESDPTLKSDMKGGTYKK